MLPGTVSNERMMNSWEILSVFAYSGDALERSYQQHYELPGYLFYVSLILGGLIKVIVLWNTFQIWTAPGAVKSISEGILALAICLVLLLGRLSHPDAFKKHWRVCFQLCSLPLLLLDTAVVLPAVVVGRVGAVVRLVLLLQSVVDVAVDMLMMTVLCWAC